MKKVDIGDKRNISIFLVYLLDDYRYYSGKFGNVLNNIYIFWSINYIIMNLEWFVLNGS